MNSFIDFIIVTFFPILLATVMTLTAWGIKAGMEYLSGTEVNWVTAFFVSIMFISHIFGGYIDTVEIEELESADEENRS